MNLKNISWKQAVMICLVCLLLGCEIWRGAAPSPNMDLDWGTATRLAGSVLLVAVAACTIYAAAFE